MTDREWRRAPRLRAGDRVAVVATSGPIPAARLATGCAVLREWGLDVLVMPSALGEPDESGYLAAPDAERAADFVAAWCDPLVRAVWVGRGGYGAQRIVDHLDWDAIAAAGDRLLIGFSDVTAMHLALGRRLGLSSVHGPVVTSLGDVVDAASKERLRRMLFEPESAELLADSLVALTPGRAMGPLLGGNLTLLSTSIGTVDAPDFTGAIVVLEEVHEHAYRIDRLLTHLLRGGWLDRAAGIVVGSMPDDPDATRRLVADRLGGLGIPVVTGAPIGHADRNHAFPVGRKMVLDTATGTLALAEPALR